MQVKEQGKLQWKERRLHSQIPELLEKLLSSQQNLAAIGVGEGQRGAIEMEERFARDAKRFQDERDAELERARQNMRTAYGQLESDYPGYKIPGYQAGGITSVNPNNYMSNLRGLQALAGGGRTVQNFNRGGRTASDDYNAYMGTRPVFGPGTAAQRQANIRGSQVISPEQLQGYRPGFGPEINYFQRPSQTTPPGTGPGTRPGDGPPGNPPGGPGGDPGMGLPPGDISGGPGKGGTMGGIADFDYSQFAESEAGREAIANFRDLTGISDVTNRLSAIEERPDPNIPQIDYDEITNRVRGGIDIPEFDLSGIESRLGAIEDREIPGIDYDAITQRVREGIDIPEYTAPSIDYDAITQRVREGIDIPAYDTSGIMDAIAANREAIAGMPAPSTVDYDEIANRVRGSIDIPAVDLSGIENRLGAIEGREMPTFDTSGIMSAIDANRQAISGIPSVDLSGIETRLGAIEGREMPAVDLSGIESRLGAIEGREMPTFDTSNIMSAIDANRQAIAGIPATDFSGIESRLSAIEGRPDPTFDTSGLMSAIDANRQAIAGMPAVDLSGIETRLGAIEGREMPTVDLSGIESRLGAIEGREMPTFDTSGLMSAIDANRQAIAGIPATDLSGLQGRLDAIEARPDPTFDTSGIMSAIDANRQAIAGLPAPTPAFDSSGIMDAIAANREAIAGMPAPAPAVDLSGIQSRLDAIESRPDPTFDTSGIMDAIASNREAIASMPAPAPAFDSSGLMDAIAANREAISNLPAPAPTVDLSGIESRLGAIEGRADPTFDTSGLMDAIAANREAIAGMPAPAPAFDASEILAAIEANRKAIGGINSGGINPNPTAGIPTAPVKQAPVKSSPIRVPKGKGFAEGGETEMSADQGSRIIDLTIAAVMGQLPEDQAETVINRFVDEFGSEAFAILRRQVLQGNVPGAQTEGKINGNGGGMDDKVPGMIGDQQPVAVSPGEFIVPADVVSGLGDGSTDAGVKELHGMMDRVRNERTGMKQQPRPVNKAKVMPV